MKLKVCSPSVVKNILSFTPKPTKIFYKNACIMYTLKPGLNSEICSSMPSFLESYLKRPKLKVNGPFQISFIKPRKVSFSMLIFSMPSASIKFYLKSPAEVLIVNIIELYIVRSCITIYT